VKWLAEFDNTRFGPKLTPWGSRVRFVQVAQLHFSPDMSQICYLEEYMQSANTSRYKWPSLGITKTSEEDLQAMFRMEEGAFAYDQRVSCVCDYCGEEFASRNQLFTHLRKGGNGTCGIDETGKPALSRAEYASPQTKRKQSRKHVAFTVSYSACANSSSDEIPVEDILKEAVRVAFPSPDSRDSSMSWATRTSKVHAAIVNVFTMRLHLEVDDNRIEDNEIVARVNQALKMVYKPIPYCGVLQYLSSSALNVWSFSIAMRYWSRSTSCPTQQRWKAASGSLAPVRWQPMSREAWKRR